MFAIGGVLSLVIYLQYQGLITATMEKIQRYRETTTSSIANYANLILHYGITFGNNPIGLSDLATPFTGSMIVGLVAGFLRG